MTRKKHKPEEIIAKLRQVEVMTGESMYASITFNVICTKLKSQFQRHRCSQFHPARSTNSTSRGKTIARCGSLGGKKL